MAYSCQSLLRSLLQLCANTRGVRAGQRRRRWLRSSGCRPAARPTSQVRGRTTRTILEQRGTNHLGCVMRCVSMASRSFMHPYPLCIFPYACSLVHLLMHPYASLCILMHVRVCRTSSKWISWTAQHLDPTTWTILEQDGTNHLGCVMRCVSMSVKWP